MFTPNKTHGTPPKHPTRAGISPPLFYGVFALLIATNAITGLAFYMSGDLNRLLGTQNNAIIAAYEDRLTQMRVEIDRLNSRVYAQAGDINLQLQEVSQQQDILLEQQQLVRALVDKASQMGVASLPAPAAPLVTEPGDIGATADAIALMLNETQSVMTAIAQTASTRTHTIASELKGLGIYPDTIPDDLATGGPLLPPLSSLQTGDMLATANEVMSALMRYKTMRASLDQAPVHMPLADRSFQTSSTYGNRKDPFTRGLAFHSGLDFAAPTGTTVTAAGSGRVTFVGTKAGYGKTVEITHSTGLITRYGHLSAYIANEGQEVALGTPIAKVGSTGRSTGPHLHFEVRKSDRPLDPKPFLDAGKRIRATLIAHS